MNLREGSGADKRINVLRSGVPKASVFLFCLAPRRVRVAVVERASEISGCPGITEETILVRRSLPLNYFGFTRGYMRTLRGDG